LRIEEIVHLFADAINMDNETGMLIDWEWVESESVSLRSWPLIEKHVCISSFSVVLLSAPFSSHQKWESHRNHLGITWDLSPSWSPCMGGKLLGDGSLTMQGDLEGMFLIHDTKVLNPELSVAV
jgi:hypothetical protein